MATPTPCPSFWLTDNPSVARRKPGPGSERHPCPAIAVTGASCEIEATTSSAASEVSARRVDDRRHPFDVGVVGAEQARVRLDHLSKRRPKARSCTHNHALRA